jgi:Endodeoxyribonuclease RusA
VRTIRGQARILKTKEARQFDDKVFSYIALNNRYIQKIRQEIEVTLKQGYQLQGYSYVCLPKKMIWTQKDTVKKFDQNNRLKPLIDAVSRIIGVDDSHFFYDHIEKVECEEEEAHCVVAIGPYRPAKKSELWISRGLLSPN